MSELDRYTREVSEYRLPILERVPEGARVLDVGTWTGAHGRWLMERSGATVDGVELDQRAAAEARGAGYGDVLVGSIEDPALQARIEPGYDVVMFLDVLEHLVHPDDVLAVVRDWLAPGGSVLVSLPNVAHWRVRLALLRGRFDYVENGLMDRTHLRWFTRVTARELVEGAGYRVTWEDAAVPQHPRVKVPQRLLRPELFGYQLFFEGTPA